MNSIKRAWLPFISLVALSVWASASSSPPPAPKVTANAFGYLTFNGHDGELPNHGRGFVARCGSHRVLLTVLHLFGPEGGMDEKVPAAEIPGLVAGVDLETPDGHSIVGVGKRALLHEGVRFSDGDSSDATGDIVAFDVPSSAKVGAINLAKANPAKGSWVYIVAWPKSGTGKARLLPHRIVYSGPRCLGAKVSLSYVTAGLSGCPVINRKGELVAMFVGHADTDTDKYLVFNPVQAIRARVTHAYASARRR